MVRTGGTTETLQMSCENLRVFLLTIAQDQEDTASTHGTVGHCLGVELDYDQPPDGQHQGVPDGHRVQDHGEVHMEQKEETPVVRKL